MIVSKIRELACVIRSHNWKTKQTDEIDFFTGFRPSFVMIQEGEQVLSKTSVRYCQCERCGLIKYKPLVSVKADLGGIDP